MAVHKQSLTAPIQEYVEQAIEELVASLPSAEHLSDDEQRGIIARYSAVLEGNFIYWMTAAHLAVVSDEARAIIEDNLREEVRDNHPGMLRRFATAARALPTDGDALAVSRSLEQVRRFVGELDPVRIVVMMAFFEGFITRFMPYLADLAARRGSAEQEYTDVHGVVDVVHTAGLFRALEAEMARAPESLEPARRLAGVGVLSTLLEIVVHPRVATVPAEPATAAVDSLVVQEAA
jgi:hypothetical protein